MNEIRQIKERGIVDMCPTLRHNLIDPWIRLVKVAENTPSRFVCGVAMPRDGAHAVASSSENRCRILRSVGVVVVGPDVSSRQMRS
jgi:hypothetical protein